MSRETPVEEEVTQHPLLADVPPTAATEPNLVIIPDRAGESGGARSAASAPAPADVWHVRIASDKVALGQGTLRQMTYFPLLVKIVGKAPEDATPWADNTLVYRRYSELVLLRRYLLLKYTGEFVPPLPAKSAVDTFSTAMCNNETLTKQQLMVSFFVQRLSENPALYTYDPYVAPFLQMKRDDNDQITGGPPERPGGGAKSFGSFTLLKTALEQDVAAQERQLDRSDPNVFASGSSAVLTGWVRNTASFLSGVLGHRSSDPLSVTEEQVHQVLSGEPEYLRWSDIRAALVKGHQELTDLAKLAGDATCASREMEVADRELQNAFSDLSETLSSAADKDLKVVLAEVCDLSPTHAMIYKATTSVAAHAEHMLFNEALLMESIIDTVNLLLNRYRSFAHRRLDRISHMSPAAIRQERINLTNTGGSLNDRLRRWRRGLVDRFEWLNKSRATKMSSTLLSALEILEKSNVWQLLQRSDR